MTSTLNSSEQCRGDRGLSNTGYLSWARNKMGSVDPLDRGGIESDEPEVQQYLSGSYRSASSEERRRIRQRLLDEAGALESRAMHGDAQSDIREEKGRKTVLERLVGYEPSAKPSVLDRLEPSGRLSKRGVLKHLEPEMTLEELEGCLSHAERMRTGVEPGQTGLLDSNIDDPLPPAAGF